MTLADMSLSEIRERIRAMTEARNKLHTAEGYHFRAWHFTKFVI